MASKNIFDLLPDSEPETDQPAEGQKKPVKQEKKKEKESVGHSKPQAQAKPQESQGQKNEKYGDKPLPKKTVQKPGYTVEYQPKFADDKEHHHEKGPREGPKPFKGVSAEPHPLDRRSGTGRGKEVSKGGAGRRNWGTSEDEVKADSSRVEEKPAEVVVEEELEVEKKVVEPEVEQFTLEEYYNKRNIKHEQKKEEPKPEAKKIDYSKKIEGCEVIKTREQKVLEEEKIKLKIKDSSYKLTLNSENSELLGFQTGLVTYDSSKKRGDRPPYGERPPYNREEKNNKEKEQVETTVTENEPKVETTENQEESREENRRGGRGGRGRGGRGRGGREGRGGGEYRGGNEYRGKDSYNKKKETMPNLENEKDFPSLG